MSASTAIPGLAISRGVITDVLTAKTSKISVGGGLKLDSATNVTTCAAADAAVMRYNTTTKKLEICDGIWRMESGRGRI